MMSSRYFACQFGLERYEKGDRHVTKSSEPSTNHEPKECKKDAKLEVLCHVQPKTGTPSASQTTRHLCQSQQEAVANGHLPKREPERSANHQAKPPKSLQVLAHVLIRSAVLVVVIQAAVQTTQYPLHAY